MASRCSTRWPGRWRRTMHRQLDEKTLVGGQIAPDDVPALKELGVTMIVNNRPDGEDAGQPDERRDRGGGQGGRHRLSPRADRARARPVGHRGDARGDALGRRRQAVRLLPLGQSLGAGLGGGDEARTGCRARNSTGWPTRPGSTSARSRICCATRRSSARIARGLVEVFVEHHQPDRRSARRRRRSCWLRHRR